ncbi:flagellar protein FliT [Virgibacillus natechei]|uniref:Flagellar protein FliT n=1 Tax=Virgibacillus natechei TaxID=1216297 RepID=A0ABS4IJN9_9BACI|nr:flagellar protein FliT [Virgibacillus natechei]MBP1971163.1 flagellar protein FliT [Virgibacillus natechei]UZD11910.1 flagellar protein FliT [Virgibacillus natechei]
MNRLTSLYEITLNLKHVLDKEITAKNREEVIEKVNQLVEKRSQYIEELVPPYTEEEKQLGQQLVQLNEAIQVEMNHLFSQLKTEMKQVKKQKKSNRTYTNPYKSIQAMDGMFMDSKK